MHPIGGREVGRDQVLAAWKQDGACLQRREGLRN